MIHRVDELDLPTRAVNALRGGQIVTIGDLCSKSEAEMLCLRRFGPKSLSQIKVVLARMGLHLRD